MRRAGPSTGPGPVARLSLEEKERCREAYSRDVGARYTFAGQLPGGNGHVAGPRRIPVWSAAIHMLLSDTWTEHCPPGAGMSRPSGSNVPKPTSSSPDVMLYDFVICREPSR